MPFELVPPGTHIDFIGKRRIAVTVSIALLLAGAIAVPINGVKLGIDFQGGTEMQVLFEDQVEVDEGSIRNLIGACGIEDPIVVRYGETDHPEFLIRFQVGAVANVEGDACPLTPEQMEVLERAKLAGGGGGDEGEKGETIDKLTYALTNAIGPLVGGELERVEFVGPRVGSELRADGVKSLLVACVLILIYIAFRFNTRFAPGAIVALVHDIGITAGIFVILGMEFDLRVLAALLAILGYSLNDTIIIYDRIRENMELRTKFDLVDVLNQSVNQTLARTVITSGTTMVAVLALWILGGEVIRPFAIAMAIGIVIGTYSSVFIASPALLFLERHFGGDAAPAAAAGGGVVAPDAGYAVRHDAPPPQKDFRPSKSKRKKNKKRR
ncbi:MAG: protein translocase subunit SecF [Deltaproteobacteria bacterium]|nr:protein translocase subunit SecF [Deltaproteobacteria bacterium]